MDRTQLIKSLEPVVAPPTSAADEYAQKMETMVGYVNEKMKARSDIAELLGDKNNIDMMMDNHLNHARFIESIVRNFNPEVLTDTVIWVFKAYRSRGFHDTYWASQLNYWMEAIKENLSEENYNAVFPIYKWMQNNIPQFVMIADQEIDEIKNS